MINLIISRIYKSYYKGIIHYEENEFFTTPLETIQKHYKIKYDYCKNNNIDLLKFSWEFNIIYQFLIIYVILFDILNCGV